METKKSSARRSSYFADLTLELTNQPIIWYDSDGHICDMNLAASKLYGYSRKEMMDITIRDLIVDYSEEKWKKYWFKLVNERNLKIDSLHKRKNDITFYVEESISYMEFEGQHYACSFITVRDKESWEWKERYTDREKHEALFRTTGDAVIFVNINRKIVLVNRAFSNLFGYEPDEIVGKESSIIYASHDEFIRQGKIRYNLRAKEKVEPYEVTYRRKNGEQFQGETVGSILFNEEGNIFGFGGIIRDVTEKKEKIEQAIEVREYADIGNVKTLERNEIEHIKKVLEITNGRISGDKGAAKILGINPKTLESRMRKYKINRK
jgi:PAS domain S-box-containing protein